MTFQDKQKLIDFINTLVPEIRDELMKENIGNNMFNRYTYKHREFSALSFKEKLLYVIDSFHWSLEIRKIDWCDLNNEIMKCTETESLKYAAKVSLVTRAITL